MLEGVDLFSGLSKEELSTLELFCQERFISKGEKLFTEGEQAIAMYILKSGLLEVYNYEKIIGIINPGDLVGEMAMFLTHKTRMASVKAVEDSIVIIIPSFSIDKLSKKHPEIIRKIKKVADKRNKQNKGY